MSVSWESKKIHIKGGKLHFLEEGRGNPMILLPGFGAGATQYRYLMPRLSDRFRLFSLDLIGFGESDKPDVDYSPEFMRDQVIEFIEKQNLDKVNLLGCSMGTRTAVTVVVQIPEKIEKIILINPIGKITTPMESCQKKMEAVHLLHQGKISLDQAREIMKVFFLELYGQEKLADEVLPVDLNMWESFEGRRAQIDFFKKRPEDDGGTLRKLSRIENPFLIIYGEPDPMFPYENIEQLVQLFKNVQVEKIPGGGHSPHEILPEAVSEKILEFFGLN